MATRRRVIRDPYRWFCVHTRMWCARGGHDVTSGTWMRVRRDDHRQLHSCADCLARVGVERPARAVTLNGGFDLRKKQAGDE